MSISPLTEKVQARVGLSSVGPSAGLEDPLFEMATRLCVGGMAGAIFEQLWVPDLAFHVLPASSTREPTWFSVAGWHSSNRIPNALGAAFLFFLIMLIPQGVLGAAALSSGMNSSKEN